MDDRTDRQRDDGMDEMLIRLDESWDGFRGSFI
jgi:hypothetical protein